MPEEPKHETARVRSAMPTALTLIRPVIGITALVAYILDANAVAAWLYLVAFVTDVADGLLARALEVQTQRGARLDGLADVAFHALFGIGIVARAAYDGSWVVCLVVVAVFVTSRLLPGLVAVHTALGKLAGGLTRIVIFACAVALMPDAQRPTAVVAGFVVFAVTYAYETIVTLHELHSGERPWR